MQAQEQYKRPEKDSLEARLQRGAQIINRREWGKRSALRYIRETTEKYPQHVAVWVQAFTVAIKAKHVDLAMLYRVKAELLGAGALEKGGMERDLALYYLQQKDLEKAWKALDRARQHHADLSDPNLLICLDVVEARLMDAAGGVGAAVAAYRQMWRCDRVYEQLRDRANKQWHFNLLMVMLRNSHRRWDKDARKDLRRRILMNPCCHWRHRWTVRLMRLPWAWHLMPR